MAIYDKDDQLQKWKYSVNEIKLLIPGEEVYSIPTERLNAMYILHDYENNVFPIFKITLVLESYIYHKIIKVKDNVKFRLRIQKYYHTNESQKKSLYKDFLNDTFDLILDDETEDFKASSKRLKNINNYETIKKTDENQLEFTNNEIEFFLYKADTIKGLRNNVNAILDNATVTDAVSYILTQAKVNNVLMTPPVNTKRYESLVIPPLRCLKALQFIDTYYGLYKTGSVIYFDFNYGYILAYNGKCSAYRKKEIKNTYIVIPQDVTNHSTECGVLYKKNNNTVNYIVGDYKTIDIRNQSISNDIINSNDVQFIDNYSGNITSTISGAKSKGINSVRILENKTENSWLGDTYTAQTSSESVVIPVKLYDFDLSVIAPNKRYKFIFEDPSLTEKYNGVYMISSIESSFINEGKDLALHSVALFKKVVV